MAILWEKLGELDYSAGKPSGRTYKARKPIGVYYQPPSSNNKYKPKGLAKAYDAKG